MQSATREERLKAAKDKMRKGLDAIKAAREKGECLFCDAPVFGEERLREHLRTVHDIELPARTN